MQERYVLLTAAKNEEAYITKTIESVLRQSVLPVAWFIMDDGSTDRTATIVEEYASKHPFIKLCSTELDVVKRDFGAKDRAINAGYARAKQMEFDLIGIQDADISPEDNCYYQQVLQLFRDNPRLGIAGGYIYEQSNGVWHSRKSNSMDSVAGGIQMFRRSCFDQIGGFTPLRYGGSDSLTQIDARMMGWEIQTLPGQKILHYRHSSSAEGKLRGFFRAGFMDASFGVHPIFEFFKCGRRITSRPFMIGGATRFLGYIWWKLSGRKPLIQADKIAFLRAEQMSKLKRFMHF